MVLINLYNAKEDLINLLQDEDGFVGVGITTESKDISELALCVLYRQVDSPIAAKIPKYFEGYRVVRRIVGDVSIQELGFDEIDGLESPEEQ
jgi:hypothetical protein